MKPFKMYLVVTKEGERPMRGFYGPTAKARAKNWAAAAEANDATPELSVCHVMVEPEPEAEA